MKYRAELILLVTILEKIQKADGGITAIQLGLELGLSERTIRSYVSELRRLGAPIKFQGPWTNGYFCAPWDLWEALKADVSD